MYNPKSSPNYLLIGKLGACGDRCFSRFQKGMGNTQKTQWKGDGTGTVNKGHIATYR